MAPSHSDPYGAGFYFRASNWSKGTGISGQGSHGSGGFAFVASADTAAPGAPRRQKHPSRKYGTKTRGSTQANQGDEAIKGLDQKGLSALKQGCNDLLFRQPAKPYTFGSTQQKSAPLFPQPTATPSGQASQPFNPFAADSLGTKLSGLSFGQPASQGAKAAQPARAADPAETGKSVPPQSTTEVRSRMASLSMQDQAVPAAGDATASAAQTRPDPSFAGHRTSMSEPANASAPAPATAEPEAFGAQHRAGFAAGPSVAAKLHANSVNNMASATFPSSQAFWFPPPSPMKVPEATGTASAAPAPPLPEQKAAPSFSCSSIPAEGSAEQPRADTSTAQAFTFSGSTAFACGEKVLPRSAKRTPSRARRSQPPEAQPVPSPVDISMTPEPQSPPEQQSPSPMQPSCPKPAFEGNLKPDVSGEQSREPCGSGPWQAEPSVWFGGPAVVGSPSQLQPKPQAQGPSNAAGQSEGPSTPVPSRAPGLFSGSFAEPSCKAQGTAQAATTGAAPKQEREAQAEAAATDSSSAPQQPSGRPSFAFTASKKDMNGFSFSAGGSGISGSSGVSPVSSRRNSRRPTSSSSKNASVSQGQPTAALSPESQASPHKRSSMDQGQPPSNVLREQNTWSGALADNFGPLKTCQGAPGSGGQERQERTYLRVRNRSTKPHSQQGPGAPSGCAPAGSRSQPQPALSAEVAKHRKLGNSAFKTSAYEASVRHYSRALELLSSAGRDVAMMAALYSNRAAARLMLGQPVTAVADCEAAVVTDPTFSRARLRLATCRIRMGELSEARAALAPLMSEPSDKIVDVRKKVAEITDIEAHLSKISRLKPTAPSTLNMSDLQQLCGHIDYILQHVEFSCQIRSWRAEALLQLCRFTEAVAEADRPDPAAAGQGTSDPQHWRWWLKAQAFWHQGELEKARQLIQDGILRLQQQCGLPQQDADVQLPDVDTLKGCMDQLNNLLSLKEQGNQEIKASRPAAARELYTQALKAPGCPAAFAAVLASNCAAARHKEGALLEAVADCCRARALWPSYHKPYSRQAAILVDLSRPDAAARTLEAMQESCSLSASEKTDASSRLKEARLLVKTCKAPNHYRLLGLEQCCTTDEVRKAYKKLALRYHPDKAVSSTPAPAALPATGASALASDSVASSWERRVREEAEWLFKCISEAHTVLSDPHKRAELDVKLKSGLSRSSSAKANYSHRGHGHHGNSSHGYSRPSSYGRSSTSYKPAGYNYGYGYFYSRGGSEAGCGHTYDGWSDDDGDDDFEFFY